MVILSLEPEWFYLNPFIIFIKISVMRRKLCSIYNLSCQSVACCTLERTQSLFSLLLAYWERREEQRALQGVYGLGLRAAQFIHPKQVALAPRRWNAVAWIDNWQNKGLTIWLDRWGSIFPLVTFSKSVTLVWEAWSREHWTVKSLLQREWNVEFQIMSSWREAT